MLRRNAAVSPSVLETAQFPQIRIDPDSRLRYVSCGGLTLVAADSAEQVDTAVQFLKSIQKSLRDKGTIVLLLGFDFKPGRSRCEAWRVRGLRTGSVRDPRILTHRLLAYTDQTFSSMQCLCLSKS